MSLQQLNTSSCPSSPAVKKAYRLVILGSSRTGKSSIIKRFLDDTYDDGYTPTIEDVYRKLYRIRGEFHQLDILDTSGNDPFPAARRLCLLTGCSIPEGQRFTKGKSDIFVITFSVDNLSSYEETFRIRQQILDIKSSSRIGIVIVANKMDLDQSRQCVSAAAANEACSSLGIETKYVECSAKTGEGVFTIFKTLFELAKLPKEMSPGSQQKMEGTKSPLLRLRSRPSDPGRSQSESGADPGDRKDRRKSLRKELFKSRKQFTASLKSQPETNGVPSGSGPEKKESGELSTGSPRLMRHKSEFVPHVADKNCVIQ